MPKRLFVLTFLFFCLLMHRADAWKTTLEVTHRFRETLPAALKTEGFAMRNVRVGLLDALIPDRCGVTAIQITPATAERIGRDGLAFFETAMRSRSNTIKGRGPFHYEPWTRINAGSNFSVGDSWIMAVFSCAGFSGLPSRRILEGLTSGNAYVSSSGGSDFYLLPDQRLFVQAFID